MEIELKRIPRSKDASDEHCVWELIVNGYSLGMWYGGKVRKYEDKYSWANEQLKKRIPVLQRNIARLSKEKTAYETELQTLTNNKD